jgi:hypothetical protein
VAPVIPAAAVAPSATPVRAAPVPRRPVSRPVRRQVREAPVASIESEPGFELVRDAALEEAELIAALDRWLSARNANAARQRVPVIAMRVGTPQIVFDPSGTSASVTYRKRFVYSRASQLEQSTLEEQVFFARLDGLWQMVNPG